MKQRKHPTDYPLRTCRYLNECCKCLKYIYAGQKYYDGGYGLRYHKACAEAIYKAQEEA